MLQLWVFAAFVLSFGFLFIKRCFFLAPLLCSFSCSFLSLLPSLLFSSFFCLQLPGCFALYCCLTGRLDLSAFLLVVAIVVLLEFLLPALSSELVQVIALVLRGSFVLYFRFSSLNCFTLSRGLSFLLLFVWAECLT